MEDKHPGLPVSGYRPQNQTAVDAINALYGEALAATPPVQGGAVAWRWVPTIKGRKEPWMVGDATPWVYHTGAARPDFSTCRAGDIIDLEPLYTAPPPVMPDAAAFDLLEALADRMEANGDRERAGCLRACFARGTGGIGPIEYMVDIIASEITAPVAWTNALSIEAVRERPKESAWLWGAPNGRINIPLYAHPLAVEGASFRKGGVFDAPPFCPICGKTGTHFHGPDTVRQHREEQSK